MNYWQKKAIWSGGARPAGPVAGELKDRPVSTRYPLKEITMTDVKKHKLNPIRFTAYWFAYNKPDKYKPSKRVVTMGGLSKAAQAALGELGVNLRDDNDERGVYFKPDSEFDFKVYDSEGEPWPEDVAIGNGSTLVAHGAVHSGVNNYGPWAKYRVHKFVVEELVEFDPEELDSSDEDEELEPM